MKVDVETHAPRRSYEVIRNAIRNGEHGPGSLLTEGSLSETLGVSRTPIREALLRLEQEGLLTRTSRGMRVPVRTVEEVADLYEVILLLEPQAAALAAHRNRLHDVMRLRQSLALAERDIAEGTSPRQHFDEWHGAVWECSGNPVLIDALQRLSAQLALLPARSAHIEGWRRSHEVHVRITELVAGHDAGAASSAIEEHLWEARDSALLLLTHDDQT